MYACLKSFVRFMYLNTYYLHMLIYKPLIYVIKLCISNLKLMLSVKSLFAIHGINYTLGLL